ncbi:MAG: sigma-70 family RNA polymerase sigma factor [Clostridia bacterium]|nr:sigma-70 family RNA polymerase sigma factor [Clostridia bacterium]
MDNGASSYRRFLDGDDEGLRDLIEEFYDRLALYLNTYLNNMNDAEEVAETVFVILATKKPEYGGKSSFRTWLYSIGRNKAVDFIRENSGSGTSIDECAEIASEEDVERNFILDERKRAVHRALSRIKKEYAQVLWLFYFDEMTLKEIASVMKKTENGVDHLLRRARQSLKEEMIGEGYNYEGS